MSDNAKYGTGKREIWQRLPVTRNKEKEQGLEQDQDQYERQHSSLDESGFNTSSLSHELYEQDFVRQQTHDDWQSEPHSNLQFDTFHEAEVAAIAWNANPPAPIKTEYSHDVIAEGGGHGIG